MPQINLPAPLKRILSSVNIPLLLFLLVFTVDKVVFKIAGLGLIFLLNPDFSFRFKRMRIPLFYLYIIVFEGLKFAFLNSDFGRGHTSSFLVGCAFWVFSLLALYQLKSLVDKSSLEVLENTITTFFLINLVWSLGNLLIAMLESGSINPYGLGEERFGSSTGDMIKGVFMAPCYINMMVNSFFIFYFLYKKKFLLASLAMLVVVLTTSNFSNLILIPVLLLALVFKNDKKIRLAIVGFLGFFVVFYLFVTPSNLKYLKDSVLGNKKQKDELVAYQKQIAKSEGSGANLEPGSLNTEGKKRSRKESKKSRPAVIEYKPENVDKILSDTSLRSVPIDSIGLVNLEQNNGKVLSFKQTYAYWTSGVKPFLFGSGIGGYSSFLAERMSGVNREEGSRLFSYLPEYKSPTFEKDHYRIFKTIYSLPEVFHSIKHFPNSFVNQIIGEYGLLGLLLFLSTYVLFFLKRFKKLSYGRYLLLLMGGFLLFDYFFEYLSVVVIFELFMLIDLKGNEAEKIKMNKTDAPVIG